MITALKGEQCHFLFYIKTLKYIKYAVICRYIRRVFGVKQSLLIYLDIFRIKPCTGLILNAIKHMRLTFFQTYQPNFWHPVIISDSFHSVSSMTHLFIFDNLFPKLACKTVTAGNNCVPVVPAGQRQLKVLSSSEQKAPFWQGWLRHSFTSISQLLPRKEEERFVR